MSDLTLRTVKGTPLTNQEVDDNFSNLNTDKYESGDSPTFADATVDSVQLTGGTGDQGTVSWNTDEETLDVVVSGATLQVGQELFINARNDTVDQIDKGTPVMATGTIGASGRVTIAPMDGTDIANTKYFLGFAAENISADDDGKVTTLGKIRGYNTTGIAAETVLWISTSTAGAVQTTEPTTGMKLPVAYVVTGDASNGAILVRANNGAALSALHDVDLSSPSNGQVLKFDGTKWVNAADATSGPIGDLTDVVITSVSSGQVLKFDGTNWVNGTDSTTVASLDDIGDVTITAASNGQIIQWNGSAWVNGDLSLDKALNDLTDVTITSASNGEVLQYNGSAWVNAALSIDKALNDLTDVTITTPSDTQVLKYNGTNWVNAADEGGASSLNELSDVTLATEATGDVLAYDGTDFKNLTLWETGLLGNTDDSDFRITGTVATGLKRNLHIGAGNTFAVDGDDETIVIGYDNLTIDYSSTIIGHENEVLSGGYGTVVGYGNTINGSDSVALGESNAVEGYDSIGIGYNAANASGSNMQIAIGSGATTDGSEAISIGVNAFATSDAVAIGLNATASQTDAIAIGDGADATGGDAIAIGNSVVASDTGGIVIGQILNNSGAYSILIGNNASASAPDVIAIGEQVEGNAEDAIVMGDASIGNGQNGITIGIGSTTGATNSVVIGPSNESTSAATNSVLIGRSSDVSGDTAIAIGEYLDGQGDKSITIGTDSTAYAEHCMVVGSYDEEYDYNRLQMGKHTSIKAFARYGSDQSGFHSTATHAYNTLVHTQSMAMGDGRTFSGGMTVRPGQVVIPTTPNGYQYIVMSRTGETSADSRDYTAQATEPTWPTSTGSKVVDSGGLVEYTAIQISGGFTLEFQITDWDNERVNPNIKFAVEEVVFICTEYDSVLGAPTFDCGDGTTATAYFNGESINGITGANQFQKFTPASNVLVDKMVFKVNTAASGTFNGKFVVKGFWVAV